MGKLSAVEDISHVNKRCRQPSVVELFEELQKKADDGELVGTVVLWADNEGIWHHSRDLFNSDTPTMLGYLQLLLQKLTQRYLDGLLPDEDN